MQKKLYWLGAGLVLFAAGAAIAQTRDDNGDAVQRELEEKAVRIPLREQAETVRATADARAAQARSVQRGPNLEAIRTDLARTQAEDAERNTGQTSEIPTTRAPTAILRQGPPQPPPPGLRILTADRLGNVDQEEVDRARVPVLLPAHPDLRDKLKLYGMRNVYTATAEIDANANFSMSGTCNRVIGGDPNVAAFRKRLAEKPRRLPGTGAEFHISRNDYGVDLSFSKFGCGYVMTIECGDPAADPRCSADDYITNLADSLILANPELAGE